nr:DUF4219 domain-containing protein/UBN2 domain-containing protein [Tanacetum cinerariifolium]
MDLTIMATSITKEEYVAAASGCGQVLWIQNQMLDYGIETTDQETKTIVTINGKSWTISESSLRRHLKLNDEEGISSLPDAELFENLSLMGHNILPNQSNIATDVVCLATNRVYNFSKMIFDGMVRNINNNMSRDVLTVGSTMRILLLYRGEYSQWVERFMNYLEEQTDEEEMINSIKNGDQPLPRVTQVSIARTSSTERPPLKDKSMWSDQEKRIQKIDRLARSLLIQGLLNDIYSLIDSNKTAKDLWDALARHMLGSEYGEQDRKAAVLYASVVIQKIIQEKVVVSSDSEGSDEDDFSELKKITALLAKAFNRRKFYSKPTNNNLRTSYTSQSANKKQEFVKNDNKKVEKKDDEKKRDMRKVKCYNCKEEGHFTKDCKKAKVKDYEYYKTKMLLAKKDKDEQVLLAEDKAWMESSSDSDQEINANMVLVSTDLIKK